MDRECGKCRRMAKKIVADSKTAGLKKPFDEEQIYSNIYRNSPFHKNGCKKD